MLKVPDNASAQSEQTSPEETESHSLARRAEGTIPTPPTVVTPPTIIYQQQKQTPYWVFFGCIVAMVALLSYGLGAMITLNNQAANSATTTASSSSSTSASTDTSNVPNATQNYGDQLAPYTIDPDGAKHFTLTASQVMWNVTGGQRVLAWAINGTVPGPMIHVIAGDHVRITFINHFPKPTSIHWHGLQVSTQEDGVPGLGQPPIQPGQTYVC